MCFGINFECIWKYWVWSCGKYWAGIIQSNITRQYRIAATLMIYPCIPHGLNHVISRNSTRSANMVLTISWNGISFSKFCRVYLGELFLKFFTIPSKTLAKLHAFEREILRRCLKLQDLKFVQHALYLPSKQAQVRHFLCSLRQTILCLSANYSSLFRQIVIRCLINGKRFPFQFPKAFVNSLTWCCKNIKSPTGFSIELITKHISVDESMIFQIIFHVSLLYCFY